MSKFSWFVAAAILFAPQAADAAPRIFNVPRLAMKDALAQLAIQGHVQLLFSADQMMGQRSMPVRGRMETLAAFRTALSSSGLDVTAVSDATFVVSLAAPQVANRSAPLPISNALPVEIAVVGRRRSLETPGLTPLTPLPDAIGPTSTASRSFLERSGTRNAVEALATLSGVTVLSTGHSFIGGVDGASRGEGMYAAIRGLNTEFSLNLIDGVTMAQGMPYTRAVQLSLLPPDGLAEVAIQKASTASMDGDAIGATLDWRTPNAFDFAGRRYATLSVGLRSESRALDYGETRLGNALSAEFAGRFGPSDRVGLYLSLYSDQRYYANSELGGIMSAQNDTAWDFKLSDSATGTNPQGVDPASNAILTGLDVGVSTGSTRRSGGFFSADWRPSDTLNLFARLAIAHADTEQNSTLSQLVPGDVTWQLNPSTQAYDLNVGTVSSRVWYETNPEVMTLANLKFGGRFRFGGLTLSPTLFAGYSESALPDHIEASVRIDQNDGVNIGNSARPLDDLSITYDVSGLPVPNMTADIYNDINAASTSLLARRAGQLTSQASSQVRGGFEIKALYDFATDGGLQAVEGGFKYTTSHRRSTYRDWTNDFFADALGQKGLTWSKLGISSTYYSSAFPGLYDWRIPKVDHDKLLAYFNLYRTDSSLDTCGLLAVNNFNCDTQDGNESVSAAYISSRFRSGRFEITPGVRYEHTDVRNTFWLIPYTDAIEQPGDWQSSRSQFDEALPSIFVTWTDGSHELRFGLWRAYSRPSFVQLAGGAKTTTTAGVTTITQGNPNLKPVSAINLDLSAIWRAPDGGHVSLNLYAKALRDYLFDYGTTPADDSETEDGSVRLVQPENGGDGQVMGLELEIERRLSTHLSSGIALTRQWTEVDLGSDELGRAKPIQNAPGLLASWTLRYSSQALSADLSYTYTSAYLSVYNTLDASGTWDDTWVRPHHDANLHLGYRLNPHLRLDASLSHILGGYSYWAHVSKHSLNISDVIKSGQAFNMSLKYTF